VPFLSSKLHEEKPSFEKGREEPSLSSLGMQHSGLNQRQKVQKKFRNFFFNFFLGMLCNYGIFGI
jgi:hypothetical protein